jgi:hypothetical protein
MTDLVPARRAAAVPVVRVRVIDGSVVVAARRPFWPIAVTLLLQLLAALAFFAVAVTR